VIFPNPIHVKGKTIFAFSREGFDTKKKSTAHLKARAPDDVEPCKTMREPLFRGKGDAKESIPSSLISNFWRATRAFFGIQSGRGGGSFHGGRIEPLYERWGSFNYSAKVISFIGRGNTGGKKKGERIMSREGRESHRDLDPTTTTFVGKIFFWKGGKEREGILSSWLKGRNRGLSKTENGCYCMPTVKNAHFIWGRRGRETRLLEKQ